MIKKDILPNGLRVVTETVPYVQSIALGIWVIAGSRDEQPDNMGISHFIEHMMFKGTEKRTARQIADEFDSIGGHINAFTDKEYTCYYCKVLADHFSIAFDILSDMFLNSKFDPKDINSERNVILEEIKKYDDSPEDQIHDLFAQKVWNNHILGNPIIGTIDTVSGIQQNNIIDYIGSIYKPDSIVISAAGNLKHDEIVDYINKAFGNMNGNKASFDMAIPEFSYQSETISKKTEQVHFCIGSAGYSQLNDERFPLEIVNTTLGGGMSSRLFQEIREKRGLAYSIGSYSQSYREGGYFTVYGGTSINNIDEIMNITKTQFSSLLINNITDDEMERAKNHIRGSVLLSLENMNSRMIRIAKSEIVHNRIITTDELINSIVSVNHDDIDRVTHDLWEGKTFPLIAIGPFDQGV